MRYFISRSLSIHPPQCTTSAYFDKSSGNSPPDVNSKESVFYSGNKEICDFEREFISKTQEADGSWNITWEWESYPEQWHISKNQWKSDLIIKNVKFYNAMK